MSTKQKKKLLGLIVSIFLLMVILAISIPALEMKPGEAFAFQRAQPEFLGSLQLSEEFNWLLNAFNTVMLVVTILLPILIFLGMIRRDGNKIKLKHIFWVLLLVLITLPFSNFDPPGEAAQAIYTQPEITSDVEEIEMVSPVPFLGIPQPWMLPLLMVAAALLLAGLAYLVSKFLSDRIASKKPLLDIEEFAQKALREIDDAEVDFEDVIIRCYAEMSQILQDERGIRRSQAMTTLEFEQVLIEMGFPAQPVKQLTRLFEQVRYGRRDPLDRDKQAAAESLVEIIEHCRDQA